MKRIVMVMFSLLTVATVMLSFAGCSTGTYKFWGMKFGDKEIEFKNLSEKQKAMVSSTDYNKDSYIQLKGNETFIISTTNYVDKEKNKDYKTEVLVHGSYSVYDQKLFLYLEPIAENSKKFEAVIREKSIYIPAGQFSIIFKK